MARQATKARGPLAAATLLAGLLAAGPVLADLAIAPGTIRLDAETPGQAVPIAVSGGDTAEAMNLYLQVGAGAAGPTVTGVGLMTGTVWGGNAYQAGPIFDNPRTVSAYVTTHETVGPVVADGTAALAEFDTTGVPGGLYGLSLTVPGTTQILYLVGETPTPRVLNLTPGTLSVPYLVRYAAGDNGSIAGPTPQRVHDGDDAAQVEAVAAVGHHFVQWSDLSTDNPRQDLAVSADIAVTATFAPNTYTVTFETDGTLGASILGDTPQTVPYLGDCTPVTAVAPVDYHFVEWTKGGVLYSKDNPLTVLDVAETMTLVAHFAKDDDPPPPDDYTVVFIALAGGTVDGAERVTQVVAQGGNCTPVTAIPDPGHEFTGWTGDRSSLANPLTVTNVQSNLTIYANFAPETYQVAFVTDGTPGASILGDTPQTVPYLGGCTPVTAVAPADWHFVKWTLGPGTGPDYGTDNPLAVTGVTGAMTLVANFAEDEPPPPETYLLTVHNGVGDGEYEAGTVVPITADPAPEGQEFDAWTGDIDHVADPTLAGTTVTMPEADVTVTATYRDLPPPEWLVTFIALTGGTVDGQAQVTQTVVDGGDALPVEAIADAGFEFSGWSGEGFVSADNPLTLTNVTRAMTLYANFTAGERVACGLVFQVNADEVDGVAAFTKAPKVWATYHDRFKDPFGLGKEKKAGAKGLTKIAKGTTETRVNALWTKKIRLYNLKALVGERKIGTTVDEWLQANPVRGLNVTLRAAGKENGAAYADIVRTVALSGPTLEQVQDAADLSSVAVAADLPPGGTLLLQGHWFGNKPPKVSLEWWDEGKQAIRILKLKAVKEFIHDFNGKLLVSAMNQATGESWMKVQLPLELPAKVTAIVVDNGVGIDAVKLGDK